MSGRIRKPGISGRRGAFQLVFAPVYLIIGFSFIFMPSTPTRDEALRWLTQYVSLAPFATVWIIAGLVAGVCAFLPRPRDGWGYAALVFAPAMWSALFLIGAVVSGAVLPLVTAFVYALFGAASLIVSGMQGPHDDDERDEVVL